MQLFDVLGSFGGELASLALTGSTGPAVRWLKPVHPCMIRENYLRDLEAADHLMSLSLVADAMKLRARADKRAADAVVNFVELVLHRKGWLLLAVIGGIIVSTVGTLWTGSSGGSLMVFSACMFVQFVLAAVTWCWAARTRNGPFLRQGRREKRLREVAHSEILRWGRSKCTRDDVVP